MKAKAKHLSHRHAASSRRSARTLVGVGLGLALGAGAATLIACNEPSTSSGPGTGPAVGTDWASAKEIVIGEVGALSGPDASYGVSAHNGIALAVKEANAQGGIDGKPVRLVSVDDKGDGTEAAGAALKLVEQDKVLLILGETTSARTIAMAGIAQAKGIPVISPAATNPKVTEGRDFVFRVCFIDPFQGTAMARFAHNDLKLKKVAVLRDAAADYSVGLASQFVTSFKMDGGEIVGEHSYAAGDQDFKTQLTAIKAAGAEAVFVPGYYADVGRIAKQARELGIAVPFLGGDGWESSELYKGGGGATLEGSYFITHYAVEDPSPRVQKFIFEYDAAYHTESDAMAALGYDAARVAIAAIGRAKSTDPKVIRDQIAETRAFPGVTGDITIPGDRNAIKPAVVQKISASNPNYVTTIAP